jgi:cell wall assembly regulator SMI1
MNIEEAEQTLGAVFPPTLRELYADLDGWWDGAGQWWVVWPLDRLVAENRNAWDDERLALPRTLLAFGDDGTGNPFCAPVDGRDEVLRWSWIDGDVEHSEGTMEAFQTRWLSRSFR